MKSPARYIVAAVLLFFAWKGSVTNWRWPPAPLTTIRAPQPAPEFLALAEPIREYLPKMTPGDRQYLAHFYDAMAFIILRDGDREQPIITDTDKFEAFHGGSLRLAVDRKDVGKYGDLGKAIDKVFATAMGTDDVVPLDKDARAKIVTACGVLSWTFTINGD
jgi:hypothetical protein